ncbi:hypothetical protein LCGC14_0458080 [marine sediment metagenome]|uniref:Uncharacterized protein n=1 Tax=marine sediment metagenome TaxID=412755 RepID=A0A0F9SFZ3_9ZZZZ
MTFQLIWWWWVWAIGAYWDDLNWSVYFGPLELRVELPPATREPDNFRSGTKTPPPSEKGLSCEPVEDYVGRPPTDEPDQWDFRRD